MKKLKWLILPTIVLLSTLFIFPFRVSGNSMSPTLKNGELGLALKHSDINRFDIVIVRHNDKYLIKRVVGMPEETIEYKNDILYVNGKIVAETHANGTTNDFKITLGKDEYWCLGDNRENSVDSRNYGSFHREYIIGRKVL